MKIECEGKAVDVLAIVDLLLGKYPETEIQTAVRLLDEDWMTMEGVAMYEAGRLHVYYLLVDAGLYNIDQVAEVMDMDAEALNKVRHVWRSGEIIERQIAAQWVILHSARKKELSSSENGKARQDEAK